MSTSAISPFNKACNEIKTIANDANRQIRNYNLKTIAKIVALVALFTMIGGFSVLAAIKYGVAKDLAAMAAMPATIVGMWSVLDFITKKKPEMERYITDINKEITSKLRNYTTAIKQAVALSKPTEGFFTLSKVQMDSFDKAKKKYENDFRRHLPGFLQFSRPNFGSSTLYVKKEAQNY